MNKAIHKEYVNNDTIIIHKTFAVIFTSQDGNIKFPLPEDISLDKKIGLAKQFLRNGCKGSEIVTE